MSAPCRIAIHWFRRDLRVADNESLCTAASHAELVAPVYVLSPWHGEHLWTGSNRQSFLCGCLESLANNLASLGGRLILRRGDAVEELLRLVHETKAGAVYCQQDPDPFGRETEVRLATELRRIGVDFRTFGGVTVHAPGEVLTKEGKHFRVFTPFSRAWFALEKPVPLPKPVRLQTPGEIESLPLPGLADWNLPAASARILPAGERAARQRLDHALDEIVDHYRVRRDQPAVDGTSRLSQDLRFGLVSARTVVHRANRRLAAVRSAVAREGIHTFLKEVAWREFYMAILHHFPEVLELEFNPDWRGLPWDEPGPAFESWKRGLTGFPIVDAGMRELLATGHMHNRLRMITAMFLTKDLHLDWRLGEQWFLQQLVDGEIASNNGGWQWSAGTGADAAPYFRIQNPWSQSSRHDPDGTYIRRWLPELAKVPAALLHQAPADSRPLAADYPLPILDHHRERTRTLAIFQQHRARQR